jgi:hypothetical protein
MEIGGGSHIDARFDDSVLSTNSSEPLSSPPGSPELAAPSSLLPSHHNRSSHFNGITAYPTSAPMASTTSAPSTGPNVASLMNDAPAPKKPGRKKKEVNPEEVAVKAAKKPVIPRKPRAVKEKDPNAIPVPRKRKSQMANGDGQSPPVLQPPSMPAPDHQNAIPMHSSSTLSRQHKITDLVSPNIPQHRVASPANIMRDPPTPNPRPASSGRMFDPIRGEVDKPLVSPTPPPPPHNRASASPAIKSLMNPAPTSEPLRMVQVSSSSAMSRQPSGNSIASVLSGAPNTNGAPTKSGLVPTKSRQQEVELPTKSKKTEAGSGPPSNAPTPPQKPKISREAPPLPTGSGLLSGTPFGLTAAPNGTSAIPTGTDIWLKFDLKGKENVTINFAHEVERKYGFAALNPRLAARKERQRQMAAAGAALEKELGGDSAEDMSLDLSEPESNNDTDGPAKEGTDGEPPKKKRKKRTEDYDRNDDFIDDAELLLEEQALMTKDGFFVYSGPLIQEGERPAVERYVLIITLLTLQLLICSAVPMVPSDEDVAVVEVVVVSLLVNQAVAEDLVVEVVAALEEAALFANHASRKQNVLRWKQKRLHERRWVLVWPHVLCPSLFHRLFDDIISINIIRITQFGSTIPGCWRALSIERLIFFFFSFACLSHFVFISPFTCIAYWRHGRHPGFQEYLLGFQPHIMAIQNFGRLRKKSLVVHRMGQLSI